ncbi:BglG family transcription antiterminator [Alkalihalobacillus pseudalcaliphilus]|uniref:BglG family transcription antiterminator n=1 Tax=Alkalihalobacillus pseudalcaliphilus TaxID=79884 RepID=UPI00064DB8FA|nr:BglG family transcription antiterminator [Alkalihalobacillus pseudalcaliphilus]KMK78042.1 transcriptional antiterminator [Alkalihalobacillus pseudalcaliphilus]
MYMSARERSILMLLVREEKSISIAMMAKELEVSTRTIQRDLKGIEDILSEFHLLLKKDGKGLAIEGTLEERMNLMSYLGSLEHEEYTPEERQIVLLSHLLHVREPIKLYALANELNVTVATISNDLSKVENWLKSFQLRLIKKRGYGVEVQGEEVVIRRALSKLISENLNEDYFYQLLSGDDKVQSPISKVVLKRLMHYVDIETIKNVKMTIDQWRLELTDGMADSSYVALVVHVTLALERIKEGERIELKGEYLSSLQVEKEYRLAQKLAFYLEEQLQIEIPEEEIGYITMHLRGVKWMGQKEEVLEGSDLQLAVKVKQLIQAVAKSLQVSLQEEALYQGLLSHMKPAIYRIRNKMKIHNPLLDRIKDDYDELFRVVKKATDEVFQGWAIPDEEIGFLVMHFGSVIELRTNKSELSALVICSSGIGSSKLLASRLNKEFPEITLMDNASMFDLDENMVKSYDLVISTVPLQGFEGYIYVRPYLAKDEVRQIRDHLNALVQRNKTGRESYRNLHHVKGKTIDRLFFQVIGEVNGDIQTILAELEFKVLPAHTLEDNLLALCSDYEQRGVVESAHDVLEALIQREKLGGLAIPETSLALFHTRHPKIIKPLFSIYELKDPLYRRGMDNQSMLVKRIFILLAPEQMNDSQLALMSFISAQIIESEHSIKLYEKGQETEIKNYLANQFKNYLQDIINKEWTT